MKKSITLIVLSVFVAIAAFAGTKQVTFDVNGDCHGCKVKIEDALDVKGITYANWDIETGILVVKFKDSKMDVETIKKLVEELGYEIIQKSPPPKE